MGNFLWISDHWFDLLQSGGIVAGLFFTAAALRLDEKTQRTANLIEITTQHRELWSELYTQPELARIRDVSVDLKSAPITPAETLFVSLLILHVNSAYQAMKNGMYMKPQGLQTDIQQCFSKPIPKAIWEQSKGLQDSDFVAFVEKCLAGKP
jgi:hypothetical protein